AVLLLGGGGAGAYFAFAEPEPPIVQNTPPVVEVPPTPPVVEEPVEPVGTSEMVEEPVVPAPVMVRIVSEPEAEVWRGAEYVGRTPVELARPTGDERLDLELRAEGFENRQFLISALTSPEIEFRLERERSSSSSRMSSSMTVSRSTMEATPPTMEATMEATMTSTMRTSSEVLDPWAD
ncbi:MAG: hypothetical protein H6723_08435, partial [Sandaracinus sp.]|nr:hypothetical protein [Sandaracinus sp.]